MNDSELDLLLKSSEAAKRKVEEFINENSAFKLETNEEEVKGHIQKAEHNIKFVESVKESFGDWAVVGCYYTIYHAALALIMKKGYASKSHDATLCILIKEYHINLTDDELKMINQIYLTNEDILFYAKSKKERHKASYSSKILFTLEEIEKMIAKTRIILNKAKELIA